MNLESDSETEKGESTSQQIPFQSTLEEPKRLAMADGLYTLSEEMTGFRLH